MPLVRFKGPCSLNLGAFELDAQDARVSIVSSLTIPDPDRLPRSSTLQTTRSTECILMSLLELDL